MKKIIALMLVCVLSVSLVFAGGAEEKTTSGKTWKIGFARILEGETWEQQKTYMESTVGPALNCTFVFSEKIQDANGLRDFLEQCYAAGCDAVFNALTDINAITMAARLCQDWGMYYMSNSSAIATDVAKLEYNLGHLGASPEGSSVAYKKGIEHLLSDGKDHSIYIFSGAAVGGATGTGAASHYYATYGMLEAMQEHYGLKYSKSIDEIINTKTPGEIETGNPNIKIYIYAGFTDIPGAIKSVQTQFQTGPYDIFAAVASYSMFSNAIDAVEKSTGKNIKIIGTAAIEKQTATGFSTLDSTGDSVLSVGVINLTVEGTGWIPAVLVQALNGNSASFKNPDGSVRFFGIEPWVIKSAEEYENIAKLDLSPETYVIGEKELQSIKDGASLEASIRSTGDLETIFRNKLGK